MNRARSAAWWAAPSLLCLILYWPCVTAWFRGDDFAWLGAGIYSYMPMGLRVIRKVETIIREEMNRAGGIEAHVFAELLQAMGLGAIALGVNK